MDFSLNAEQRRWQGIAREFAQSQIAPISLERDRIADPRATFDWEVIRKGSRLGLRTLAVPRAWGGHGADHVTQALVMAELAKCDSSVSKTFSQCWKQSYNLAGPACTDDQRERFLRPFVEDDGYLLGSGTTEPNAGSDNRMPPPEDPRAGVQLKAERHGDKWLLNGEKCFIANGSVASLFFVRTRTNPEVSIREGTTVFLVPRDTPGFRTGKVFNKSGWRFYQNAELIFENAEVPHANLVGEVNGAARARTGDGSQYSDFELAANAMGVCDAAVEMGIAHARAVTRGGMRLTDQQVAQLRLSEMQMLAETLRSYVMRVAWERDQGAGHNINNTLLMNYSTDAIQRVTRLNLELHEQSDGRIDARAEKLCRDAFIWTHLAGSVVHRMKVARDH